MANKIELIIKYSTDAFDEVYRAESRIGLLDGNTKDMVFTGAKTVKIPKWSSGGMHNYVRANTVSEGSFSNGTNVGSGYGYQQSDMGYEWETFTLAIDRAAQYRVDMFDDEETAKTLVARGSTQINKQVLVPEIDAYAFSKIASYADEGIGNLEATDEIGDNKDGGEVSPLESLNKGLLWLEENEVPAEDQIIFCSPRFMQALRNTAANGLVKPLLQGEYEKNVSFTIEEYEGRKIVSVPPRRFMTNIVLGNGSYHAGADSTPIDFMIAAKSAVYHIVKYNKIKVFGPDVVQDYDGYKINVHVYHDVFVPDNKRVAIYVKTGGFNGNTASTTSLNVAISSDRKATSYIVLPGSTLTDGKLYFSTSAVEVGKTATGTEAVLGTTVLGSSGAKVYLFVKDTAGVVVAVKAITLA